MVPAACFQLLQAGFLVIAFPLLLGGSVFTDVAVRLQLQSLTSLDYALLEGAAGATAEESAAVTAQRAAADELEAAGFHTKVGADEVAAGADEAEASGAEAVDGAEDAAAAGAAEAGAAAGAEMAGGAAATGIGAEAAAGGAALAAEAVGGAAIGVAAAPVAVAAAVGTAVVQGPTLVAAAGEQWGAASAEVQAVRDEAAAEEKETEGAAWAADTAVYQAGAAEAESAAMGGLSAAVGYLVLAQALQLGALAFQAPVALAVGTQKLCGSCSASGWVLAGHPMGAKVLAGGNSAGITASLVAGAVASQGLLLGSLAALLAPTWAATVQSAAQWQAGQVGQAQRELEALPGKLSQLVSLRHAPGRRLWGLGDLAGVGQAIGSGVSSAASGVQSAVGGAAREVTHRLIVGSSTVETTTIAPMTTQSPPETPAAGEFFYPAMEQQLDALLRWGWPVLADVGLVSLAFAGCAFALGLGQHVPTFRCGCSHPGLVAARLLRDLIARWLGGVALLSAVWCLSIALASELLPAAEAYQRAANEGSIDEASLWMVASILGSLCIVASVRHAVDLSRLPCLDCAEEPSAEATGAAGSGLAYRAVSAIGAALLGLTGAVLAAAEAPVLSWALGGAFKSFRSTAWLLPLLPWQLLADSSAGFLPTWMQPVLQLHVFTILLLLVAAVVAALVTVGLFVVRHRAGASFGASCADMEASEESEESHSLTECCAASPADVEAGSAYHETLRKAQLKQGFLALPVVMQADAFSVQQQRAATTGVLRGYAPAKLAGRRPGYVADTGAFTGH